MSNLKRACIFLYYDRDGIVDEYVKYYLKALRPLVERLVIVANGKLSSDGRAILEGITSAEDVVLRENSGYDVTGYLAGIRHIGYGKLSNYDELIVVNDSIYGPIYPLDIMFTEMESRDLDLWGITGHRECKDCEMPLNPKKHILAHIQSFFTVFGKRILSDGCFEEYWETLPPITNRDMAIERHETYYTYYFEQKGFKWDTYIPIAESKNENPNTMYVSPVEVLKKGCPFIKRAIFSPNEIVYALNEGELGEQIRAYIEEYTDYDFNMIIDNLIRIAPLCDLMSALNLYRVIPKDGFSGVTPSSMKSMAIVHLYYEDKLDDTMEYLRNIPDETDIYITTPNINPDIIREKLISLKNKIEIIKVDNHGRLAGAYLLNLRRTILKYDVALLFHDKKTETAANKNSVDTFFYKISQNTIPSKGFAQSAIKLFETDPHLGVLMPTPPSHGNFLNILGMEWGGAGTDYEYTMKLLARLGVSVNCKESQRLIAPFGDIYWFRVDALSELFKYAWQPGDFPGEPCPADGTILHAIERIPCFLAQHRGYYSAYSFNDRFVGLETEMYITYVRRSNTNYYVPGAQAFNLPFLTKTRLLMKYMLPRKAYAFAVKSKRKIFGPHDKPFEYEGDSWEKDYNDIKKVLGISSTQEDEIKPVFIKGDIPQKTLKQIRRYNETTWNIDDINFNVSAIIPCYNHAKYLEKRINSILSQTHQVSELIFLDDASSDDSVNVAKQLLKNAPFPVKYIVNENNSGNVFSQWRKGLEAASGDFIWIAESDDYCKPEFLRTVLLPFVDEKVTLSMTESTIVEEEEETNKVGADIHNFENDMKFECSYISDGIDEIAQSLSVNNYILNASAVVWRKKPELDEIFASASKYKLVGDWYSYIRVLKLGDIAYCGRPLSCYRFHSGTVRDTIKIGNEYLETLEVHDWVYSDKKLDLKVKHRQRIRRDYMGGIPKDVLKKRALWVITPPAKGSGGHKTAFNHINAMIEAGYDCDLLVMYSEGVEPEKESNIIEANTLFCAAKIYTSFDDIKGDYDIAFATTWDSAKIVKKINSDRKGYFIQDYEPWFLEAGSKGYKQAKKTYHLGFSPITIGGWLAKKIEDEGGVKAAHYDFCIDNSAYYDMNQKRERAICAVYQPEKPRRYADMVCRVLGKVHELDPSITLYAYGSYKTDERLRLANVNELGIISVGELNELYNKCRAGLCISLSNPSRIPFEMMGSGLCVVDVDVPNNQLDYPKDILTLAENDEEALAKALIELVNDEAKNSDKSQKGAEHMKDYSFERAYKQFVDIVDELLKN